LMVLVVLEVKKWEKDESRERERERVSKIGHH